MGMDGAVANTRPVALPAGRRTAAETGALACDRGVRPGAQAGTGLCRSVRRQGTGPACGRKSGSGSRRTSARDPSENTQSMARTHERVVPTCIECAPAAFVDAIPPTVQKAPLDGSTGKRSPRARAARSTSARSAPGPTRILRDNGCTSPIAFHRLTSTMMPSPIAPPGMLLPDPRGISGSSVAAAQRTSAARSSASSGTATARGRMRAMPAASEYTASASSSVR